MLKIRAKCESANMGSSTVQLNCVDPIDIRLQSSKLIIKLIIQVQK